MKRILTQIAPKFNTPCVYYVDCLRPPAACAKCKLTNDTFINIGIQKALQVHAKKVADDYLKSDMHIRMIEITTAKSVYTLPLAAYRATKAAKEGVANG